MREEAPPLPPPVILPARSLSLWLAVRTASGGGGGWVEECTRSWSFFGAMRVVLASNNEMGLDFAVVGLRVHFMRIRIKRKNKLYPDSVAYNDGFRQKIPNYR
jgi:hypothetical protein